MSYKDTLNLPKTDFPIKANPQKKEPELLAFWQEGKIYEKLQDKNKDKEKYILHDGPPYPNGDIHLGHALNKILKDIVVKFKSMNGFNSPFIPGWDCHGLPIETKMLKETRDQRLETRDPKQILEFRQKCRDYALKYVDIQREEFKRLGVMGDWKNPYLTLEPAYEEKIIELFGKLAEEGYIYRGLKPIHWCPNCETALAEAEIEYEDEESPSIYVKFRIHDLKALGPEFRMLQDILSGPHAYFLIWTTTPWTLPANVAIAVHPDYEYAAVKVDGEIYVLAEKLLETVLKKIKAKNFQVLTKFRGKVLEGIVAEHPFVKRDIVVVLDELVTLELGTGLVHIAPGHGEEDYQVGLKYDLPIIMPVDSKGYFDSGGGKFKGKRYDEANDLIIKEMQNSGTLLYQEPMMHSYPHCWRCKLPVIFRATEQWFISVDHKNLRRLALESIAQTKWYPGWGENRIRGMVEVRPDWCISRQRSWGVPIPVFYCEMCGKPQMKGIFNKSIRELVKSEGTDGWFKKSAEEILPRDSACPDCGGTQFKKESDIMDVWLESGASHFAVLESRKELRWPSDLYLEGSDQHRGWFQTSLLTSIGVKGRAPYNEVLTHGFTVDEEGKKMSKSLGNVIDPQDVVRQYGADVLRAWVASSDFRNDMSASEKILRQVEEAYIKIRNTCRFLLSNLYDYSDEDAIDYSDLLEIDRWALLKLYRLIQRVLKAYQDFELHIVHHSIHSFCVNDLSALYLDIVKDRLYCGEKASKERRSAQTVIYEILIALVKLMAPILSFTAEDIWQHLNSEFRIPKSKFESVQLLEMPKLNEKYLDKELEEKWEKLLSIREVVYKALEEARNNKVIGASLEAEVQISPSKEIKKLLEKELAKLPAFLIVSQVKLMPEEKELKVVIKHASGKKCERCWQWSEAVGKDKKHPTLCERCVEVVK